MRRGGTKARRRSEGNPVNNVFVSDD